jgi:hypothetical protein
VFCIIGPQSAVFRTRVVSCVALHVVAGGGGVGQPKRTVILTRAAKQDLADALLLSLLSSQVSPQLVPLMQVQS